MLLTEPLISKAGWTGVGMAPNDLGHSRPGRWHRCRQVGRALVGVLVGVRVTTFAGDVVGSDVGSLPPGWDRRRYGGLGTVAVNPEPTGGRWQGADLYRIGGDHVQNLVQGP